MGTTFQDNFQVTVNIITNVDKTGLVKDLENSCQY